MGLFKTGGKVLAVFDAICLILLLLMQFGHKMKFLLIIAGIYMIITGFLDRFTPAGSPFSLKIAVGIYTIFVAFFINIYVLTILSIIFIVMTFSQNFSSSTIE